jgi:hypothetical protein
VNDCGRVWSLTENVPQRCRTMAAHVLRALSPRLSEQTCYLLSGFLRQRRAVHGDGVAASAGIGESAVRRDK